MNNTTQQKVEGTLNQASGAVKQAAGNLVNDQKTINSGKIDSATGKVQVASANLKEKVQHGAKVAGDAIERMGEKLSENGFDKIGAAVKKAGDKLEHSID